jgi:hypothetical protein
MDFIPDFWLDVCGTKRFPGANQCGAQLWEEKVRSIFKQSRINQEFCNKMKTKNSTIKSLLGAGTAGCLLLAAAAPVKAQPAEATFQMFANGVSSTQAGTINGTFDSYYGTATITQGSDPSVSASETFSPSAIARVSVPGIFALPSASATYIYSFEINGPAGSVGSLVTASGALSGTGSDSMTITAASGPESGTQVLFESGNFTLSDSSLSLSAGTVYTVNLSVDAVDPGGGASSSASIDPMITIDPTTIDASDYSIVFSPNFQPVPEPSTIVAGGLMLVPLGLTVLRMRRNTRPTV